MGGVVEPVVTDDVVTNDVVTHDMVEGGSGPAPVTPWVDLITSLAPTNWYRCEQASGNLVDEGFGTEIVMALSGSLAGGFQQPGQVPGETNGAIDLEGLSGFFISAVQTGSNFNSLGTIALLLRNPSVTAPGSFQWSYFLGFDVNDVGTRVFGAPNFTVQWFTSDGIQNDDDSQRTYNNLPALDQASGFHLFVFSKASAVQKPNFFLDGGLMNDFTDIDNPTSDPSRWINDFNGQFKSFGRGNPNQAGWDGVIDEIMVWTDGTVINQAQAQSMTLSAGLTLQPDVNP